MLTWVLQERNWKKADALLTAPNGQPVLLGPALTEVIRAARRRGNVSTPAELRTALQAQGIAFVHPEDDDLVRAAELLEASDQNPRPVNKVTNKPGTLSLGDGLILAMAERRGLPVVTRDQHWSWFTAEGLTSAVVVPL